ncbi:MAG: efflux transporter outer membrane subunit [Solitalea-like symbiont of Acarus siro]
MRKLVKLTIYTSAILLSACSVNNKYKVDLQVPSKYQNIAQKVSNKAALHTLEWDTFFKDANLKKLIQEAINSNFDLNNATKTLQISEKYFRQSKLNYLPNLNLAISGNYSPKDNTNKLDNTFNFNTGLQVAWEVDLWGKLRSNEQAMLAQYLETAAGRQAVKAQIIAQVAQEYYHLHFLHNKLNTLKKYQSLADSTVKIMELQFQAGNTTYLSVQQGIAEKLTIDKMLPQIQENIIITENAINFLIGKFPDKILTTNSPHLVTSDGYAIGVPSDLLRYRPDVQQAEYALTAASAKANITLKEMYPNFTITANGGVQLIKNSVWFNIPNALFALAEGSIIQPLFNKRKLRTNYEIALIEREKAVINFKEKVTNAVMEVSNTLMQLNKLKETRKIVKKKVDTLTKAVENARLLFLNGLANYLEVITAPNSLINAEIENIDLQEEYINTVINLYTALGGGSIEPNS